MLLGSTCSYRLHDASAFEPILWCAQPAALMVAGLATDALPLDLLAVKGLDTKYECSSCSSEACLDPCSDWWASALPAFVQVCW